MKNSNEPGTFRFVAQCPKQLRHRVPLYIYCGCLIYVQHEQYTTVSVSETVILAPPLWLSVKAVVECTGTETATDHAY
jgi:hypothetical protein